MQQQPHKKYWIKLDYKDSNFQTTGIAVALGRGMTEKKKNQMNVKSMRGTACALITDTIVLFELKTTKMFFYDFSRWY